MKEFTVTENDSGQRLDKFITKLMPRLPQSMMYKGFRKNCVKLNGKHAKNGAVFVEKGDTVALYFKDEFFETNREFKYTPYKLDIVYEDDNILVINKAPGILSHSDEHGCGLTVIDMVQSYLYDNGEYNPQTSQTFKPALCNRLDRNTGGLIIAAKNSLALREINSNIKRRNIQKFYTAVVEGNPPDDGRLTGFLTRENKVTKVSDNGKSAELIFSVKKRKNRFSLVEIELLSGRTHQIRAQFADIGTPLAGDKKYGGKSADFKYSLYSTKLVFHFDSDGPLAYLDGMTLKVSVPFEKFFKE